MADTAPLPTDPDLPPTPDTASGPASTTVMRSGRRSRPSRPKEAFLSLKSKKRIQCLHVPLPPGQSKPLHPASQEASQQDGGEEEWSEEGARRKKRGHVHPLYKHGPKRFCGKCGIHIKKCEHCGRWLGANQFSRHTREYCHSKPLEEEEAPPSLDAEPALSISLVKTEEEAEERELSPPQPRPRPVAAAPRPAKKVVPQAKTHPKDDFVWGDDVIDQYEFNEVYYPSQSKKRNKKKQASEVAERPAKKAKTTSKKASTPSPSHVWDDEESPITPTLKRVRITEAPRTSTPSLTPPRRTSTPSFTQEEISASPSVWPLPPASSSAIKQTRPAESQSRRSLNQIYDAAAMLSALHERLPASKNEPPRVQAQQLELQPTTTLKHVPDHLIPIHPDHPLYNPPPPFQSQASPGARPLAPPAIGSQPVMQQPQPTKKQRKRTIRRPKGLHPLVPLPPPSPTSQQKTKKNATNANVQVHSDQSCPPPQPRPVPPPTQTQPPPQPPAQLGQSQPTQTQTLQHVQPPRAIVPNQISAPPPNQGLPFTQYPPIPFGQFQPPQQNQVDDDLLARLPPSTVTAVSPLIEAFQRRKLQRELALLREFQELSAQYAMMYGSYPQPQQPW